MISRHLVDMYDMHQVVVHPHIPRLRVVKSSWPISHFRDKIHLYWTGDHLPPEELNRHHGRGRSSMHFFYAWLLFVTPIQKPIYSNFLMGIRILSYFSISFSSSALKSLWILQTLIVYITKRNIFSNFTLIYLYFIYHLIPICIQSVRHKQDQ